MAHHRVWQFRPPAGGEQKFAAAYASNGPWAQLFARGAGFIGTRLLRPVEESEWWLTIDSWERAEAFVQFQAEHADAYRALDHDLEGIAGDERFIGAFDDH